jgi:hypothetical protein
MCMGARFVCGPVHEHAHWCVVDDEGDDDGDALMVSIVVVAECERMSSKPTTNPADEYQLLETIGAG